jgi:hypothetical protein
METTVQDKQQTSDGFYKKLVKLTIVGGLAFWATTIAFSLLPIAGEFRAEVSISYVQVVLVQSLIFGLIIEFLVSYVLLRFFDKIPTKNPILKSEILSIVALMIALIVLGVAASRTSDALQVFLIGASLNVPRFLIPGIVVGLRFSETLNSLILKKYYCRGEEDEEERVSSLHKLRKLYRRLQLRMSILRRNRKMHMLYRQR